MNGAARRRIDPYELFCGWKEIADALRVAERTARRFEETEGLRVRRLVTGGHVRRKRVQTKGRVYMTGKMLLEFLERTP